MSEKGTKGERYEREVVICHRGRATDICRRFNLVFRRRDVRYPNICAHVPSPLPPSPHLTFFNISHPFLSSKTAISVFSPTWPAGQLSVIDCACACLSFIASEKREARSAEIRPAKKRQECRFEHCFATIALEERKGENGVETRARRDAKRARRRCRDV